MTPQEIYGRVPLQPMVAGVADGQRCKLLKQTIVGLNVLAAFGSLVSALEFSQHTGYALLPSCLRSYWPVDAHSELFSSFHAPCEARLSVGFPRWFWDRRSMHTARESSEARGFSFSYLCSPPDSGSVMAHLYALGLNIKTVSPPRGAENTPRPRVRCVCGLAARAAEF